MSIVECNTSEDIPALDIAEIIDAVKAEGHNRMAQVVRMVLIDVFKEAQHAGHVPPGFNPAQATKTTAKSSKPPKIVTARMAGNI